MLSKFFTKQTLLQLDTGNPMPYLSFKRLPKNFSKKLTRGFALPFSAFIIFLGIWSATASQIETSLGQLPGPGQVGSQIVSLYDEHIAERIKEDKFYQRQEVRNAKKLETNPDAKVKIRGYTGKPTFFDQILTSLYTVLTGFFIASLIAIPIGIITGLSSTLHQAINPIIQIFKPVSPLAWLPIVTMIVSAVYVSSEPMFSKSFVTSAITVALCCIWPTIINTTLGVTSIDKVLMQE